MTVTTPTVQITAETAAALAHARSTDMDPNGVRTFKSAKTAMRSAKVRRALEMADKFPALRAVWVPTETGRVALVVVGLEGAAMQDLIFVMHATDTCITTIATWITR